MPDDPVEARYWIASIDRRLTNIEAKGDAAAKDVYELKVSLARQDGVIDATLTKVSALETDISGLKTDRDTDRKTYATDRNADRRAIEWADAWRRGLVYFLGALVVAALGAASTYVAGLWERHH